jgi:hypothetical protein
MVHVTAYIPMVGKVTGPFSFIRHLTFFVGSIADASFYETSSQSPCWNETS